MDQLAIQLSCAPIIGDTRYSPVSGLLDNSDEILIENVEKVENTKNIEPIPNFVGEKNKVKNSVENKKSMAMPNIIELRENKKVGGNLEFRESKERREGLLKKNPKDNKDRTDNKDDRRGNRNVMTDDDKWQVVVVERY